MNRIGSLVLSMLLIGLFLNVALADTPEFTSKLPTNDPSSDQGDTQEFSVVTNQTMNFVWFINNIQDWTISSDNTSSYSNNTASAGDHNVTVVATNENGTISTNWTWTVNKPPGPAIISFNPSESPVYSYNGSEQEFKIDTNQTVNITWYRESVQVHFNTGTTSSYSNTSTLGTYNITVSIENTNGTDSKNWTWKVISIPPPSITRVPDDDPSSSPEENQKFSVTIDQPVNITWLMNGTEIKKETLNTSSTYSNNSAPIGTYNITVNVENANGTNTTTWMWSVVPISVEISDPVPSSSTPSTVVDETITFSIKINQSCEVKWYINEDLVQTNETPDTSASFTTSKGSSDTYTVKAVATNTTTKASDFHEWNWKVNPATYSSGNRIWDEDEDMNKTYTWNPQSFSGFYYDLDTNEGTETLTIKDIGRSISKGDIEYKTSPITIEFEQDIWKTYEVIGFMADRYFAGYTDDTNFDPNSVSSSDSLLDERQLSKVLLDTDKKYNIKSGTQLELEEGYEFRIAEFGSGGDAVMVALFKNGEKVDDDIVEKGDTFVYEKDMGGAKDMPIIAIYFDSVFVGTETSTVGIEGIFQVSDKYIDVNTGDEFGLMVIKSASSEGITMKNDDSVSLGEGDDFNLMGNINIVVADSGTLRFAPYVDISKPGTYELRGTVTEATEFEWTPFNFEGLLYDIDTGEGDETLDIKRESSDDRSIGEKDLIYKTRPIEKYFEHSGDGWKTFQSIGFMGDTYFAGYLKESSFTTSDMSLIKEGRLSKILIDEDKKYTLHLGNSLTLEEGYSLIIDEISRDGDALMLTLLKDGEEIRTDIVSEGKTYSYEVDVDGTDIPIILAYIDRIFSGMETSSIFIDGLFQISDSFVTIEKGDSYGIMEVETFNSDLIELKNDDSFSLGKGDTIKIMGDIKFKVADDDDVRFYPFQEIVVKEPQYLDLDIPDSVYENEEFTISVTSKGDEVEDVSIFLGDSEIGTTDSDGELIYIPVEIGEFKVTASKSGYESDSEDIEILYQPKVLEISAPLLVDRGETIVISVTSEGESISGASVTFGSNELGTTSSDGNITYIPDRIGTYKITASRSGYQDASQDIDVTDPSVRLVYSNLTVEPKRVQPGENVNITVEAANFGTVRDADTMTIKVNNKEIAKEELVLGPGEIMTIEFTLNRSKPGTYLVEVDGRSDTFKVIGDQMNPVAIIILGILAILGTTAVIYSFTQGKLTSDMLIGKARALEEALRRLIER